MSQEYSIYGNREYYPCGCSYIIDPKTGETAQSFPCDRHKHLGAEKEKSTTERNRERSGTRPRRRLDGNG